MGGETQIDRELLSGLFPDEMILGGSELIELCENLPRGRVAVVPVFDCHRADVGERALQKAKSIKLSVVKHDNFFAWRWWRWAHGLTQLLQETTFPDRLKNPLLLGLGERAIEEDFFRLRVVVKCVDG